MQDLSVSEACKKTTARRPNEDADRQTRDPRAPKEATAKSMALRSEFRKETSLHQVLLSLLVDQRTEKRARETILTHSLTDVLAGRDQQKNPSRD